MNPSIIHSLIYPFIHPTTHPSIYSSVCPSTYLCTHPSLHLCLSIHLFVYISIQLPIHPCITHISAYPPTYSSFVYSFLCSFTHPYNLIHHLSIYWSTNLCTHPSIHSLSIPQSTHSTVHPLNHHLASWVWFSVVFGAQVFNSLCWRNENRSGPSPRALAFPSLSEKWGSGYAFPPHTKLWETLVASWHMLFQLSSAISST